MPGINFDYTKFLREQNEKYIKKYGNDPIKAGENPQPIAGYSGHVPSYRNSIHELRVVRSLVRCINSPMKPTTATGYRSKSRQFFSPEDEPSTPLPSPSAKEDRVESPKGREKVEESTTQPNARVMSAPARSQGIQIEKGQEKDLQLLASSPHPSHISMMSAGSSALLSKDKYRPKTSLPKATCNMKRTPRNSPATSSRSSARSSVQFLREPTPIRSKHPTGYAQTLYGASYWFDWRGDTPRPKASREQHRPDSFDRDRKLTRTDGVLYHRHEGMVPKYLGYVPGYKFRHGSTFGVLTVNATAHGVANKLSMKAK